MTMSEKSKKDKRKLVEEAAERLAKILIVQIEDGRLNPKENQQNYEDREISNN